MGRPLSSRLQAQGLVAVRGGRRVVDGIDLVLEGGQWVAVVGPNGAGKSTLLQLLAGLRRPERGEVLLGGRPLAAWPPAQRARQMAWMAQQGEAEGEIPVLDVVRLGRLPHHGLFGAPGPADEAAVQQALAETGCADLAARRLSELSGGERQRVLLARALAVGAAVLLLDEPTAHLDPPHQRTLVRSLVARARAGVAVVSVLHDVTLALAADRVLVMDQGRLVADGAPRLESLRAALAAAFGGALRIVSVDTAEGPRWAALPAL